MNKSLLIGTLIAITISSIAWCTNTQISNHDPEHTTGTYSYLLAQEANNGNPESQIILAKMYMLGVNIRPNQHRASYWFEKAANNGNEAATVIIAAAYLYGGSTLGVKKNIEKGVYWTKKVASCTSEEKEIRILASNILGDMYAKGDEIPQDLTQSSYWRGLAKKLGS